MQARYYDPLIGRFLSIDPVGFSPAQPFMFGRYTYVGNDPVNLTDPTGKRPPDNTDPEKDQSTRDMEMVETLIEAAEGAGDMYRNYEDMKEDRTIGNDEYFHCKANCEATKRGEGGEAAAEIISEAREAYGQHVKRDPPEDKAKDQAANRTGRRGARDNPEQSCPITCSEYIVRGMNPKYTDGEPIPETDSQEDD